MNKHIVILFYIFLLSSIKSIYAEDDFKKLSFQQLNLESFNASVKFAYADNTTYQVFTSPEHMTEIELEPGERLDGKPFLSDVAHWKIGSRIQPKNGFLIQSVYVNPLPAAEKSLLTLATNRRKYFIQLIANRESYMPSVAWRYDIIQKAPAVVPTRFQPATNAEPSSMSQPPLTTQALHSVEVPTLSPLESQPIETLKMEPLWFISKGETLKSGLEKWLKKAGWNFLAWELDRDFPIVADIQVEGKLPQALEKVLRAYHRSDHPLYSCLKKGNKVVIISDKPLIDRCFVGG